MAEKTLSFKIEVQGVSNEAVTFEKIGIQIKNLNKELKELEKLAQKGISSRDNLNRMAEVRKELDKQKTAYKELGTSMGTAEGSITRMKAKLSTLKQEYYDGDAILRQKLLPSISKLTTDISKAEKAIGVHSRGVGDYKGNIIAAGKELVGFTSLTALAVAAVGKLKDAFASTDAGIKFFRQLKEGAKSFFQAVLGNVSGAGLDNISTATNAAAELEKIRLRDRGELVKVAQMETEVKLLRLKATTANDLVKQLAILEQADKKEDEIIKYKAENLKDNIFWLQQLWTATKDASVADEVYAKKAELARLEGEKNIRIQSGIINTREKIAKQQEEQNKKIIEGQEKLQEEVDKSNEEIKDNKLKNWIEADTEGQKFIDKEIARMEKESAEAKRIEEEKTEELKKQAEYRKRIAEEEQEAKMRIASSATDILNAIAGKNKALLMASLIADKALAIAEVIIQTQKANAATRAWGALAGPGGMILAEAAIIKNRIAAAVSVASIGVAAGVGLAGLNSAKYATGGKIRSGVPINTGTVDDTLIAVNKSETVLTQRHVAALGGSGVMRRIGVPGYADGGYIGQQAPVIPSMGFDYQAMARLMNSIEVKLDINKVNSAQNEIRVITETQRI